MECKPLLFWSEMKALYREIAIAVCRGRKRDDPLRTYLKWTKEEVTIVYLIASMTVDRGELRELFVILYDHLRRTARILFLLGLRREAAASAVCGFLRRCAEMQCAILSDFFTANREPPTANSSSQASTANPSPRERDDFPAEEE